MLINKTTSSKYAAVGDRIAYNLQVINDDAYPIDNVQVIDVLPPQLKFVAGSLQINSQSKQVDLESGVFLGTIPAGGMVSINFLVDILDQGDGTLVNEATGTYSYQAPGSTQPSFGTARTTPHTLYVVNPTLDVKKVASQTAGKLGDTIYFTITLSHLGDVPLTGVILKDQLNGAFELIPNTLTVNDKLSNNTDLAGGIPIPTIPAGGTAFVSFAVKVIGGSSAGCITNVATVKVNFAYPNNSIGTKTYTSNVVSLYIGISNFKQISIDSSFSVPSQKPDIEEICDVKASVEITDSYTIPTTRGVSNEGQILTGTKLVMNGLIKITMTYTALSSVQDMYAVYCEIPFSTYVVMPPDYRDGIPVESVGMVEKVNYSLVDPRRFYVSVALLMKAIAVSR